MQNFSRIDKMPKLWFGFATFYYALVKHCNLGEVELVNALSQKCVMEFGFLSNKTKTTHVIVDN